MARLASLSISEPAIDRQKKVVASISPEHNSVIFLDSGRPLKITQGTSSGHNQPASVSYIFVNGRPPTQRAEAFNAMELG